MPRRCRLISPTNLMLEHPILSPVDDPEFLLFAKKEFDRIVRQNRVECFSVGALVGFLLAFVLATVFAAVHP